MTHAKVEPFEESHSWALLSNSFHSSPLADLLEGLVEFTEYRGINGVACSRPPPRNSCATQPAIRRALCGENLSLRGASAMAAVLGKGYLGRETREEALALLLRKNL